MTVSRKRTLGVVAVLLVHLSLLGVFAAFRNSVFDEGVYMNAARLVHDGYSIYDDFFFPQMMLLPTMTSFLAEGGWLSFWMLRGLAVLAGLVSAALVYVIAVKLTKNHLHSLIALGVYTLSGLIISWHALFTAHVFAHLLTLTSFLLWIMYSEKGRTWLLIVLGVVLSALFNMRATFLVLVPLYAASIIMLAPKMAIKNTGIFLGSMIPLTLPTLGKLFASFDNFIFDVYKFQLMRESNQAFGYMAVNKLTTLFRVLIDPHILLIMTVAVLSSVLLVRRRRITGAKSLFSTGEGMALMNLVVIAAVYLLPHPMMRQYTEQYLAFAIIIGSVSYSTLYDWLSGAGEFTRRYAMTAAMILIFAGSLVPYLGVYIFDVREGDRMYALAEIDEVVKALSNCGESGDAILAEWAGYAFLADRIQLERSEIIGWQWNLPLTSDEYQKVRLPDYEYLRNGVVDKIPGAIVTVNRTPEQYADAVYAGYERRYQSAGVTVFCRK